MNYREINEAILTGRDVDPLKVKKDEAFYRYLHNNKVAYYYSKFLSTNPTDRERWIIRRGDELNSQYAKTLSLIKETCDRTGIVFIVYKTHKFIPEVVDGDIDLIVHEGDFDRFLQVFRDIGFECEEDEPRKGKCLKAGFNLIEPHVTVSWRGSDHSSPEELWKNALPVETFGISIQVISPEYESEVKLKQVLYVPEYLTLQDIIHLRKYPPSSRSRLPKALIELYGSIKFGELVRTAPIFLGTLPFFVQTVILLFRDRDLKQYILSNVLFVFWKARYALIRKLPFSHDW